MKSLLAILWFNLQPQEPPTVTLQPNPAPVGTVVELRLELPGRTVDEVQPRHETRLAPGLEVVERVMRRGLDLPASTTMSWFLVADQPGEYALETWSSVRIRVGQSVAELALEIPTLHVTSVSPAGQSARFAPLQEPLASTAVETRRWPLGVGLLLLGIVLGWWGRVRSARRAAPLVAPVDPRSLTRAVASELRNLARAAHGTEPPGREILERQVVLLRDLLHAGFQVPARRLLDEDLADALAQRGLPERANGSASPSLLELLQRGARWRFAGSPIPSRELACDLEAWACWVEACGEREQP